MSKNERQPRERKSEKRLRERRQQEELGRQNQVVGEALESVAGKLRRLSPPVISTISAGNTVVLNVKTDVDLPADEQMRLVEKTRPIIEQQLRLRGFSDEAISALAYLVHYEDSSRNMRAVGDALKSVAGKLRQLTPPVISTFHLGPFGGNPDGFEVTLVVATGDDVKTARECRLIEQLRPIIEERLRNRGYPVEALSTFTYLLASQEDIDKSGGWYNYLR
jgi:hypothetical protein